LGVFTLAVFSSAALVFLVEPMIGRLVLPALGGTSAIWNTSLAFFQAALLVGYAYAHLLQRIRSMRLQAIVHGVVLSAAAVVLPLQLSTALGPPSASQPALWLLGVLALSVGPPFAALSATAPLIQAWHARLGAAEASPGNPYALYAASNLGSLLALLAYPVVFEPMLRLKTQTLGWSLGYAAFGVVMALAAGIAWRANAPLSPTSIVSPPMKWRTRLIWIALAAAPSSSMLGVTSYITTDIASAPFLWVAPLALYLLSFIIAFQTRPWISSRLALRCQAAAIVICCFSVGLGISHPWPLPLLINLLAFFLTALVCNQALAAGRPPPDRLTEFYLLISLGGVIGGAFNAFLAPVIFKTVLEYPLVLMLACLARPPGHGSLSGFQAGVLIVGALGAGVALVLPGGLGVATAALAITMAAALVLRDRAWAFVAMCAALMASSHQLVKWPGILTTERGFFGVLKLSGMQDPVLRYTHVLLNGTTVHGAQAQSAALRCRPEAYYAKTTPIGQVFTALQAREPAMRVGVVGMGAGTVAAYVRASDSMRFFEINPQDIGMATNPADFTYIYGCARGPVDWVIGDARLTLAREPPNEFDLLLVDAFSSDSVPAHLLTVEAMRSYLARIKPEGVIIMHLSNRNLELAGPVAATARAAGGAALQQDYFAKTAGWSDSVEQVVIVARNAAALEPYRLDKRWRPADSHGVRAWTDDYTNLFGAMVRKLATR
jgi:hypothetical protein